MKYMLEYIKQIILYLKLASFCTRLYQNEAIYKCTHFPILLDTSSIQNKFILTYYLSSKKLKFNDSVLSGDLLDAQIVKVKVNQNNLKLATGFFLKVYSRELNRKVPANHLSDLEDKLEKFLSKSTDSSLYLYNRTPIGLIGVSQDVQHPIFKQQVNHIGVIAYDKFLISKAQAILIKQDWFLTLKNLSKNNLIFSARVESFNFRSLNFFKNFNFNPEYIEIKRAPKRDQKV